MVSPPETETLRFRFADLVEAAVQRLAPTTASIEVEAAFASPQSKKPFGQESEAPERNASLHPDDVQSRSNREVSAKSRISGSSEAVRQDRFLVLDKPGVK